MREILFKAKTKDNHEWVYGYYKQVYNLHFIDSPLSEGAFYSHSIDPETICQYTGLTNKNGNKIWENDVVFFEEEICTVSWSDKDAQFTIESEFVVEHFGNVWSADCEVYGNVFDNPELVKGGV